jgi:hypothetical protein
VAVCVHQINTERTYNEALELAKGRAISLADAKKLLTRRRREWHSTAPIRPSYPKVITSVAQHSTAPM